MRLFVFALLALLTATGLLSGCADKQPSTASIILGSGYWRPISPPNILLPVEEGQAKLEYDHSQCHCGIFPKNVPTPVMSQWNPDQQRMIETSIRAVPGDSCPPVGQSVFVECMRGRGWEPTLCAGRLPTDALGFCTN